MVTMLECWYGPSGEGKSTAAQHLIAKIYNETGKIFRAYVGEGSSMSYIESGLVDAGVVQLMDFSMRDYPLTTCQQICEGMWPEDPSDPNSKMRKLTPKEMAQMAGWIFEGASVMGAYILGNTKGGLAQRAAEGEKIGQDSPIAIVDPVSGLKFGGNPMSHFNVVQRHMHTNIQRTRALPGIKIWTAHEKFSDSSKEDGADKFIGPEIAGKAMTAWISREFNNTLHFCTASKQSRETDSHTGKSVNSMQREYRVYTRDHADPDGLVQVRYKAVNRCAIPSMMPDYLTGDEPGANILEFYRLMGEARKQWTVTKLITRTEPADAPVEEPAKPATPPPSPVTAPSKVIPVGNKSSSTVAKVVAAMGPKGQVN